MFLTATNLLAYLTDVGLASAADVVDHDLSIVELGRRNRNFRVMRSSGASLFVKQVPVVAAETSLSLLREAGAGQLALEEAGLPTLAAVTPRLLRYDPRHHVLVQEVIPEARCIAELLLRPDGIALDLVGAVAATLGRIHHESARPGSLARVAQCLGGEPPWIVEIGTRAEALMPGMSGASRELVDAIRARPVLTGALALLGRTWRRTALMHGDVKWDNIVVAPTRDGGRQIHLVDWELCNVGDPLWDMAGMMAALLQIWLLGGALGGDSRPGAQQAGAWPIGLVHPAAVCAWQAYRSEAGPLAGGAAPAQQQLALLTGARLVLMAFELSQHIERTPPAAAMALSMAAHFFLQPAAALRDLLGLQDTASAPWPRAEQPWRVPAQPHFSVQETMT
ncbi:aminoglycoside phosphotransferase family protein [Massilia violaceinigra]|uniref:Aminoglycoside phosphotransferase family protein n=1 Tax=Massilia violaceinigra TaxID=2045208 RepID=A0ABY4A4P0_9BURK|nr:aminoglycoside phosphotransferase family protein [Massilia violaceinigra]UOD29130.1 aminoglycoside phosphotransferase family protein [Massilia violaceinigra]